MIRRLILSGFVLSLPLSAQAQAVTWKIDPGHTSTQFAVRHMVVATVRGGFESKDGGFRLGIVHCKGIYRSNVRQCRT